MLVNKFRKIVNTKQHISTIINGKSTRQINYRNTNHSLSNDINGIKTGTTVSAGCCVVVSYYHRKTDEEYLLILLNSSDNR